MRLAAAAAAACALLVTPLAAHATVAATAVQALSVRANDVDVAFTNTGDEPITSFRYVVPGDFHVSAPQVDGASCAVTEAREYTCTGLSVPAGVGANRRSSAARTDDSSPRASPSTPASGATVSFAVTS